MVNVDKFLIHAYITVGGKLTVHDWQEVFDPAFGVVVARSRCGRIVDRRVLVQLVASQPKCKRCLLLSQKHKEPPKQKASDSAKASDLAKPARL